MERWLSPRSDVMVICLGVKLLEILMVLLTDEMIEVAAMAVQ